MEKTLPKPSDIKKIDPKFLCHGRYGTPEMVAVWGPEQTYAGILNAQASSVVVMSDLHPDIVPPACAADISSKANLAVVKPERMRQLEDELGHDVGAVNKAFEEQCLPESKPFIGLAKTSADSTETAKALQLKASLEIVADSLENLRDITLEKAVEWRDIPNVDLTHLLDALPGSAGRPLAFYAEMMQSDLNFLHFVYDNSIVGKWADMTGCHHSATDLGIDGMRLQEEYCDRLGIEHMTAPAQIPGREFLMDNMYLLARIGTTVGGLARYVRTGKGDDIDIFYDGGKKRMGSSANPRKDVKGGNPTAEEQAESYDRYIAGAFTTSKASGIFDYGRDLTGSASDRIIFDDAFKFGDHTIRNMAKTIYNLGVRPERCKQRLDRTMGAMTAERMVTYLTDRRKTDKPMPRSEAHHLLGELATKAYNEKRWFHEVLLEDPQIASRLSADTITQITNPLTYMGQSKEQIDKVFNDYHGKKTLAKPSV